MKKLTIAMLAVPLLAFSGSALAGDAAAGEAKAEELYCLDCHMAEDFEGLSLEEIKAALGGLITGDTPHPPGIEDMTKEDIPDLAAYFHAAGSGE